MTMDCQKTKENLYRYLDRELEEGLVREVESHLTNCPLCHMALERERKFNAVVKNHLVCEEAPYDLREKIIVDLERPVTFIGWFGNLFPKRFALNPALAVAIGVIAYSLIVNFNQPVPIYTSAVQNHIDYVRGGYPLEIRTSNVDEAMSWFNGKMDYAIGEPHINRGQANLVGARLVNINDKKSAYFVYEKDGHNISAFYVDLNGAKLPRVPVGDIRETPEAKVFYKSYKGYKSFLCLDKTSNTGCVIVSDMPRQDLEHIIHDHIH